MKNSNFYLNKWYLDCVNASGDLLIVYTASLKWRLLPLHLVSRLSMHNGLINQTTSMALRDQSPQGTDNKLHLHIPALKIEGSWIARMPAVSKTLLETDRGQITWHCLQPSSDAHLVKTPTGPMTGVGYAERLEMTLAPRELEIKELRWGRFTSVSDAVIWIQWIGADPRTFVIHNGMEMPGAEITGQEIRLGNGLGLNVTEPITLRSGQLNETVLTAFPFVRKFLPADIPRIHETKWRCRGVLKRGDLVLAQGWIIHEVVHFSS